jgi:hypothetical protein
MCVLHEGWGGGGYRREGRTNQSADGQPRGDGGHRARAHVVDDAAERGER